MLEAAFGQRSTVGLVRLVGSLVPIEEVGNLTRHRRMETDALLDDREAFGGRLHLRHVGGVMLRRLPAQREPDSPVVDANPVAYLAPEQFVDRKAGGLACYVPERHLDRAHCASPGLEGSQTADLQHDPLAVRGV